MDPVRQGSRQKVYEFKMAAGSTWIIRIRSTDFDTFLRLRSEFVHRAVLQKTGWPMKESDEGKKAPPVPEDDDDITD
jgi:hypothetical protein